MRLMSRRKDRESDLSRHVAAAIGCSWREYWSFVDAASVDRDEALSRARILFDLAGDVQYAQPPGGWADHQLNPASMILAMIGDGYALLSVEWSDGMPLWSLPDFESAANALASGAIDVWCEEHGHPVAELRAPASREPPRQGITLQHQSAESVDIESNIDDLRVAERPEWPEFSAASKVVAAQLDEWSALYRSFIDDMAGEGADTTLRSLEQGRMTVAASLSWVRRSIPIFQHEGAKAEAIVGLALIAAIVRSVFLAGTAVDIDDYRRLHVLPLEVLDRSFDEYELIDWVASET
jgi:hypothetical protein